MGDKKRGTRDGKLRRKRRGGIRQLERLQGQKVNSSYELVLDFTFSLFSQYNSLSLSLSDLIFIPPRFFFFNLNPPPKEIKQLRKREKGVRRGRGA